jgi:hypothetical protein
MSMGDGEAEGVMMDGGSIGSATCPKCGLGVSPGYPKCPKCHAVMPVAPSLGAETPSHPVQGGTSVSSGPGPYVWIAVAGVLVVAAVVIYVARGSNEPATTSSPVPAAAPESTREPALKVAEPEPDPFATTDSDLATTARGDLTAARTRAVGAVDAALEGARLWGTVTVAGEQLHIHSAYCASITDEHVAAGRDGAGTPLFETVSCFERHGPLVWERPLSAAGAASP